MTVPARTDDPISERITAATQRLKTEFSGQVAPQDVENIARQSLQTYEKAVVLDFVPLFVERFTRERLKASISQPHP